MQRRAYALAIYTGQRKSDLVALTRAHRKDGLMRVKQGKTRHGGTHAQAQRRQAVSRL